MALIDNVISIDCGQGLDTKTDPKMVVGGKLLQLQDGVFTNAKRITKRNGYDSLSLNIIGGGTISSPTMSCAYKNELLCAGTGPNGQRLFSWSSSLSAWQDRGQYVSAKVTNTLINAPQSESVVSSSMAVLGNYQLFAYDVGPGETHASVADGAGSVYFTVVDGQSGAHLADSVQITSAYGTVVGYSKAVLIGTSQLAVFYISVISPGSDPSSSARLCFKLITISASGVSVGSEVIVGSPLAYTSTISPQLFPYCYDVISNGSSAIALLSQAPDLQFYSITASGAVTSEGSITSSGNITPVKAVLDSTGTNVWFYWASAGSTLYYAVYSASTFSSVLTATSAQTGLSNVQQISAYAGSNTALQNVYVSSYTQPAAGTIGVYFPVIKQQLNNSNGTTGSITTFLEGADLYTSPFSVNGASYIGVVAISPTYPVGMIVDLAFSQPVAQFLPGAAEGLYSAVGNLAGGTAQSPTLVGVKYPGTLSQVWNTSGSIYSFAAGKILSITTNAQSGPSANLSVYPITETSAMLAGISCASCDFDNIAAYQTVEQQDTLVLNGGAVQQYDGANITEINFLVSPDNISAVAQTSSGTIGSGTFGYYFVYRWTDTLGNVHRSQPSTGVFVFYNAGSTNRTALYVAGISATTKQNVVIECYRTTNGGTIPYLFATSPNAAGYQIIFDDGAFSDSALAIQPELYTVGGAVLGNTTPPPSMVLWANNNRLWCVDSENPESNIEYSKTSSSGTGISFSTGLLELVIDSKFGEITGASPMDEKTVILKENGIGYFIGDGANDSGTGSSITNFQFIPSDVGCEASKSVILFPDGILFQASNNRGIYLLSRGISVQYFGFPVEKYNSQDVTSALIVPNKNQIRFLTSSGSSLLYDYIFNQWSVFTNHAGLSACAFGGLYVYVRADGLVYKENETSFLDDTTSYALTLQTAWLALSSVQNFERVRWCLSLGDYENGTSASHGIQIQAAYDFSTTFGTAAPYYFGQASTSGAFQYRNFFSQQKADSLTLLISEIVSGASGEYIDLSNLSLVAALKRGSQKVPASQSVGAA